MRSPSSRPIDLSTIRQADAPRPDRVQGRATPPSIRTRGPIVRADRPSALGVQTERRVIAVALAWPTCGPQWVSDQLAREGVPVAPATIRRLLHCPSPPPHAFTRSKLGAPSDGNPDFHESAVNPHIGRSWSLWLAYQHIRTRCADGPAGATAVRALADFLSELTCHGHRPMSPRQHEGVIAVVGCYQRQHFLTPHRLDGQGQVLAPISVEVNLATAVELRWRSCRRRLLRPCSRAGRSHHPRGKACP